ncbi:MAG: ABC transporter permease [Saprospiraceae bacterium]|nr:ABC transporter permease [Saprospiraceae bacterium]
MDLFKHNIKISIRNFRKYGSSFLINLIGLSTGLACVLMIYLWVQDERSIDQFHAHKDRLYQLQENVDQGNGMITRITTAGPTAAALQEEFPEVEQAITTTWIDGYTLSREDKNLSADGIYAGDGFFDLFSWELLEGDKKQVLTKPNNMVISDEMAYRLFGRSTDVIGEVVEFQRSEPFQIAGVFSKLPSTSSLQFDFILPFSTFWDQNEWVRSWYNTAPRTYILLKEGADIAAFNDKVDELIHEKTEGQASHRSPFAVPFSDRYLYGNYENGVQSGGRIEYVRLFSVIALFILLIACINFMNLSTARASRRLKEIGVKKTVGARKQTLIFQYLQESLLLMSFAMIAALLFVWLLLPQFNVITGKELFLDFNGNLILGVLVILLGAGLLAGSYPAFYLSRFDPVVVLKGTLNPSTGESWARKGLVTFQFTLSVILIVAVIVVLNQIEYTQTKNLGYSKENILIIHAEGGLADSLSFNTFLSELSQLPHVAAAAGSGHDMTGHNGGTYGLRWPGKDPNDRTEFERMFVTYDFIDVMEMEMVAGRSFNREFAAEHEKIIFNEAGIKFMGLEDPIGQKIVLWGNEVEIIGVVKDFIFDSFHEEVKPIFFALELDNANYFMAKLAKGNPKKAMESIAELHRQMNPGFQMNYRFLDDDYQQLYESENRVSVLSGYFAVIAIIISCLGLFGLASFSLERRAKEIGIRKVLGSSALEIMQKLTYDLTKMVLIAVLIGLPISYLIANSWLNNFEFRIALQWWFFAVSGLSTLLVALVTVGFQSLKAAKMNPVRFLRDE